MVQSLVLASTSRHRRTLLERFGIPFTSSGPHVDETALPNEDPIALVHRLARAKAQAVAQRSPDSVIIGADQVGVLGKTIVGKPGTLERCIEQLKASSGQRLVFHTGVHVLDSRSGKQESYVEPTNVLFRKLSDEEIRRYVDREKPLDCAGSAQAEALGIALLERLESQDPTTIIGLPLIWLSGALRRFGYAVP